MTRTVRCSIGIMAHNEVRNIGALLDRLAEQRLDTVRVCEIIVVASGCTDGTEAVVEQRMAHDPRVRLITEPVRRGKAAAINKFLAAAGEDVCVLQGADTLPGSDTIERLVRPFLNPDTGMTGAHPVPLNTKDTFAGYVVHFLWEVHHQVALRRAKCGELVAFRRVFRSIPPETVVDEPQIEALVRRAGLDIEYVPDAVVYNLGPDSVREILMRRRSITAGYLALSRQTRFRTATQARRSVLRVVLLRVVTGREPVFRAIGAVLVECLARVLGFWDFHFSRGPVHVWTMAPSTKAPALHAAAEESRRPA